MKRESLSIIVPLLATTKKDNNHKHASIAFTSKVVKALKSVTVILLSNCCFQGLIPSFI